MTGSRERKNLREKWKIGWDQVREMKGGKEHGGESGGERETNEDMEAQGRTKSEKLKERRV